jgi:hypothetical protein
VICARLAGSGLFRKEKKARRRLRGLPFRDGGAV